MKKWMTILASLLLLSGCGAKEDTFSLSAAEQEAYEESIDKVTEDFYWEYDHSSLSFGAAVVPEATEENERLFDASSACEYNLKGKAGQDAVLAQALAGILTHPVGGPRRIQLQDDMYRLKAMLVHDRADLPQQMLRRRTARIGRGKANHPAVAVARDAAHHTKVGDGEYWHFRIRDRA